MREDSGISDIDWVVFDLGGVVLSYTERLDDLAERLGVPADLMMGGYTAHRRDFDQHSDAARYWTAVAQQAGAPIPDADRLQELAAIDQAGWNVTRPDTIDLIEDLHRGGFGVAVCSNAPSSMGRFVELQPWARRFQHFVFSGDLGTLKPEPAIYDAVLRATGGSAERTAFLDDLPENVAGAQAAGWQAFLFTDAATARRDLATLGVLV